MPRFGRLGFSPFEGSRLELSGFLGGSASLASNSAMRAVNVAICYACASNNAAICPAWSTYTSTNQGKQVIPGEGKKGCAVHA